MNLTIEADGLLEWMAYLNTVPARSDRALARGLKTVGEGVVRNITQYVADQTGLENEDIEDLIHVEWPTPNDLNMHIDASEAMVLVQEADWARPWSVRDTKQFQPDTLVKIITSEDDGVCEVCKEAAEASPYSMDDINNLQAKWADWEPPTPNLLPGEITNLVHPRCRCTIQPWTSTRKLPVTTGSSRTPPELFNLQQLSRVVMDELNVELRVK